MPTPPGHEAARPSLAALEGGEIVGVEAVDPLGSPFSWRCRRTFIFSASSSESSSRVRPLSSAS